MLAPAVGDDDDGIKSQSLCVAAWLKQRRRGVTLEEGPYRTRTGYYITMVDIILAISNYLGR